MLYSEIPLLRPPKFKTSIKIFILKAKAILFFHFLHPVYIWVETTFWTVQKWSLRPLLDSPKGGLNIGNLLYLTYLQNKKQGLEYWWLIYYGRVELIPVPRDQFSYNCKTATNFYGP